MRTRTTLAMLIVTLFALMYAAYIYLVVNNLMPKRHPEIAFGVKNGMIALSFISLSSLALWSEGLFERAWIKTGITFMGFILTWRCCYDFRLIGNESISSLLICCGATAIISIMFFIAAYRHKLLSDD